MYSRYTWYPEELQTLQNILKQNQDNIIRGVDTYWLAKPLRTGIGQKHYATIEGGDNRMRYMLGVSFNNVKGAMKGSDRNTANISGTLSYSYKNLIFRNTMEYTNNWANESPYGEFSTYAELNPYWSPYDENGNLVKLLGMTANRLNVYNPLYNASLNTKNSSSYAEFRDNFGMEWNISSALRFTARATFQQNDANGGARIYDMLVRVPDNNTSISDSPFPSAKNVVKYCRNGRVVIVRNGICYNVQGQVIEEVK